MPYAWDLSTSIIKLSVLRACVTLFLSKYAAIGDAHHWQEWQTSLSRRSLIWKSRATEAIGMSTLICVTIGSAAATAAGVAFAAAQGIAQSASGASGAQLALPDQPVRPPAEPDTQIVRRPKSLRRSNFAGDLGLTIGQVRPACDLGQNCADTYTGSCRGLPRSVYFGSRPKQAIAEETTPNLQSSSSENSGNILLTRVSSQEVIVAQQTAATSFPQRLGTQELRHGRAGSSTDVSLSEILTQLRAQAVSTEELQRAVRDLQDSAVRLEARVSDLEIQWQHQEQVGPTTTEYYQVTPRDNRANAGYDDHSVPPSINNLATFLSGGNALVTEAA